MIRKFIKLALLVFLLGGGAWYLFHRTEINSFDDALGLLKEDGSQLMSAWQNSSLNGRSQSHGDVIIIASFDLHDFHEGKLETTKTAKTLVAILSRYDLIAVQGIQSPDHDALIHLMDCLQALEPGYDYVIGPRSSHTAFDHQFAFIYNRKTIELDRTHVYTVQDPDDVISHDPLVGWFRARGDEKEAFTFSLVNIKVDPSNKASELRYLQKIKLAVKSDGHQEDDILLIGNFQENSISMLNQKLLPGCEFIIRQDTTDLGGQRQLCNLAFPVKATAEFTGRTGVYDFLTDMNLSVDDAKKVSKHLPIWGEFFTLEGKASGFVASISK